MYKNLCVKEVRRYAAVLLYLSNQVEARHGHCLPKGKMTPLFALSLNVLLFAVTSAVGEGQAGAACSIYNKIGFHLGPGGAEMCLIFQKLMQVKATCTGP